MRGTWEASSSRRRAAEGAGVDHSVAHLAIRRGVECASWLPAKVEFSNLPLTLRLKISARFMMGWMLQSLNSIAERNARHITRAENRFAAISVMLSRQRIKVKWCILFGQCSK